MLTKLELMRKNDYQRIISMSATELREFSNRYFKAARAVRRKWGRKASYRFEWLDGAWFYRSMARNHPLPEINKC